MTKYGSPNHTTPPRPNVVPDGQKPKTKNDSSELSLKDLRKLMADKILDNEDNRLTYVANVAMFLFDNLTDNRLDERNFREEKAVKLLELIFKS